MDLANQIARAEKLRALHTDAKLLVLPNIWDPLGARLLESLGYPAVATASAAIAFSLAIEDGECIEFDTMVAVIDRISRAVDVPVTADIERGYADTPEGVGENVRRVIETGAVGINIEDGIVEGGPLRAVEQQCERIAGARIAASDTGVPLVINARIDTFLEGGDRSATERLDETILRAKAYLEAGADCVYPILVGDIESLSRLYAEIQAPINVYAPSSSVPLREFEQAGISRISVGPGMLYTSFTAMKRVAEGLLRYDSYEALTGENVPGSEIHYLAADREEWDTDVV